MDQKLNYEGILNAAIDFKKALDSAEEIYRRAERNMDINIGEGGATWTGKAAIEKKQEFDDKKASWKAFFENATAYYNLLTNKVVPAYKQAEADIGNL